MRYTKIFASIALMLALTVCVGYAKQASDFTDFNQEKGYGILNTHWALNDIEFLLSKNAINGVPDGNGYKFEANRSISRSEFAAMVVRLLDLSGDKMQIALKNSKNDISAETMKTNGFTWEADILTTVYYYGGGAIAECKKDEWNKPIRRSEMAFIAITLSENMNGASYSKLDGIEKTISDRIDVKNNKWAEEIYLACSSGIMSGNELGVINPADTATRAEACAIVARLTDVSRRQEVILYIYNSEAIFNHFIETEFVKKPLEYYTDAYDGSDFNEDAQIITDYQQVVNKLFIDMNGDNDKELVLTSDPINNTYNVTSVWDINSNGEVVKLWARDGNMGRYAIRYSIIEYNGEVYLNRCYIDNAQIGYVDGVILWRENCDNYLYKYTGAQLVLAKTYKYTQDVYDGTKEIYQSELIEDGVVDNSSASAERYNEINDKMRIIYNATAGEYDMGLSKKLREVTDDIIVEMYCDDFDKNGSYEAFVFTGEVFENTRFGCNNIVGDVWFVTNSGVQKLTDETDPYIAYTELSPSEINIDEKKIFYFNYLNAIALCVVNGDEVEITKLNGSLYNKDDIKNLEFVSYTYDGMVTKSDFANKNYYGIQFTDKEYWRYIDKESGEIKEYGAIEISKEEFLKLDGADVMLDSIAGEVYNILYRENGVININIIEDYDEEYYCLDNLVVKYKDSKIVDYYSLEGIYLPAINPEIAVYPEKIDFK